MDLRAAALCRRPLLADGGRCYDNYDYAFLVGFHGTLKAYMKKKSSATMMMFLMMHFFPNIRDADNYYYAFAFSPAVMMIFVTFCILSIASSCSDNYDDAFPASQTRHCGIYRMVIITLLKVCGNSGRKTMLGAVFPSQDFDVLLWMR